MNRVFQGYSEGKIMFQPTFKYDKGTNQFDSSFKCRPPAWTDRVLYNMAVRSLPLFGKVLSKSNIKNENMETERNNKSKKVEMTNENEESIMQSSKDVDTSSENYPKGGESVDPAPTRKEFIPQLSLKKYYSIDSYHSDHRPVCAEFLYRL